MPVTSKPPALPQQIAPGEQIDPAGNSGVEAKVKNTPTLAAKKTEATHSSEVQAKAAGYGTLQAKLPQTQTWSVCWDNLKKQALRVPVGDKNRLRAEPTDDVFAPEGSDQFAPAKARWPDGFEADVPNLICADVPSQTPETAAPVETKKN